MFGFSNLYLAFYKRGVRKIGLCTKKLLRQFSDCLTQFCLSTRQRITSAMRKADIYYRFAQELSSAQKTLWNHLNKAGTKRNSMYECHNTYDNIRQWSNWGQPAQTVKAELMVVRKVLQCIWWDWQGISTMSCTSMAKLLIWRYTVNKWTD